MKSTALVLSSLIVSIILLVSGNAFLMTLLGLRLSMEQFSAGLIGWVLVFYSFGFVAGTLWAGRIIEKVGHIRAFAVFAAVLATSILLYPMAVQAGLWGGLRALGGFVVAGLMIVIESWFSSKADNRNRATLFAVYQLVFFLSTAAGQVLIRVANPADFVPFSLAAILITLALVPLSMTRHESPVIVRGERMSLRSLYRVCPQGALGALIAGILISAFYAMGPVFADRIGLDLAQISNFMALAIIAAMLFAWPMGRVCDRFNRYRVLTVVTGAAVVFGVLAALLINSNVTLLLAVALYLGFSSTLYPIAVAITNDLMESHLITATSTALLLSYGIGSCIGPPLTALFMELFGPRGLFICSAGVLAALFVFLRFGPRHAEPRVSEQEEFYTITPEAAIGMADLDPRNSEFETASERESQDGVDPGQEESNGPKQTP